MALHGKRKAKSALPRSESEPLGRLRLRRGVSLIFLR